MSDETSNTIDIQDPELHETVDYDRPIDSETEDLIYADELEEGMIVLSYGSARSSDSLREKTVYRVKNRWCEVTKLRVDSVSGEKDHYYFVGVYADGDKHVRTSPANQGWVVKKASIPVYDVDPLEEKIADAFDKVRISPQVEHVSFPFVDQTPTLQVTLDRSHTDVSKEE